MWGVHMQVHSSRAWRNGPTRLSRALAGVLVSRASLCLDVMAGNSSPSPSFFPTRSHALFRHNLQRQVAVLVSYPHQGSQWGLPRPLTPMQRTGELETLTQLHKINTGRLGPGPGQGRAAGLWAIPLGIRSGGKQRLCLVST